MEGKPSEGRDCLRDMVDCMQVTVYLGVVQQPMKPVGEELVVKDMQEEVEGQQGVPLQGVLHLREVRIAQFDEGD